MTLPNKTERRAIVDTHRHPWGAKMRAKMEEPGLLDPKKRFPKTNAEDSLTNLADREWAFWKTSTRIFRLELSDTGFMTPAVLPVAA